MYDRSINEWINGGMPKYVMCINISNCNRSSPPLCCRRRSWRINRMIDRQCTDQYSMDGCMSPYIRRPRRTCPAWGGVQATNSWSRRRSLWVFINLIWIYRFLSTTVPPQCHHHKTQFMATERWQFSSYSVYFDSVAIINNALFPSHILVIVLILSR